MPALERVLGFSNRWYRIARKESEERELPGGVRIRAVSAPLFLATKTEAFRSRGRGDFVASHDLEDIIAVVDGRPTLADEVKLAPARCAGSWPPGEAATGAPCHQGAGNPAGARSRRS